MGGLTEAIWKIHGVEQYFAIDALFLNTVLRIEILVRLFLLIMTLYSVI